MKKSNRILLLALFASIAALGLRAQTTGTSDTTSGSTSGSTGTGTTTGGSTTTGGASTTGGSTTTGGTTTEVDDDDDGAGKAKGKSKALKGPNENASETAKAVHAVIASYRAQREQYLTERNALLEKLKTATEAEKAAILEQLRKEREDREDGERSLGRQIREELKKLRTEAPAPTGAK